MPQQFPSDWTAAVPDADGSYLKRCVSCGERFASRRSDARFCSASCRSRASRSDARFSASALIVIASRCELCGGAFLTQNRGRRPRFCSARCRVTHHRLMRDDAAASDDSPARHDSSVTHEALRLVRSCESPGCVKTFAMTHPAQRSCVTHRASSPVIHDAAVKHEATPPTVTQPASPTVNHDAVGGASARCLHCGESLVRSPAPTVFALMFNGCPVLRLLEGDDATASRCDHPSWIFLIGPDHRPRVSDDSAAGFGTACRP